MAYPGIKFVSALRRFGAESAANKTQLQTWKTAALTAIGEGQGGAITSGSGNGLAFGQVGAMTNMEWFAVLDEVLQYIDAGLTPTSRTIARII